MTKHLSISIGQYSTAGRKSVNQDFHGGSIPNEPALSSKGVVLAIADGISSSKVSQIASETAVKCFLQDYYCTSDSWSVKKSGSRVLEATNSWLYAQTRNSPHRYNKDKGYICTFSAIIFKSNTAHLFHTGDTRIYRLDGENLEQLTNDHRHFVSAEENYLTRALGIHNKLDMDYHTITVSEGDIFILTTDGVHEFVDHKTFHQIILENLESLDKAAQQLVEQALQSGSDDNLTIQIARVNQLPDQNLGEVQQQVNDLPSAPVLKARMEFEGFTIIRDIYISSRSHVFLALDNDTEQKVIIKTPSVETRENHHSLENLMMEDWIAKRINNAHVLKAIDPSRKRHYLYTVTEYIEGQTLTQWMTDNPKPSIGEVRDIIEQIAIGLQAFHRQEMVHQDLRPANIMIDTSGTVKIIDFGSTKVSGISEIVPRNEGIMGTAQFTAPEYFLGQPGTNRSDIYSLGVIAYQMLSGRLPYGTSVSQATNVRAQGKLKYRSLLTEAPNIPGWVDYAIQKATQVNPLKRYSEVSEFIYELKHPNRSYQNRERPPLLERDPVLFWQCVSLGLLVAVIYLAAN